MNKENNKEVFQCICGKQFDNKKSLGSHKTSCKIYQESVKEEKLKKLANQPKPILLPNGMFKCECCGKEHDGSYGSGRFCSKFCHRSFAAKHVLNRKSGFADNALKNRAPYGTWKCERCNLIFETRAQLFTHNHEVHPIPKGQAWNKGLTTETDNRVKKSRQKVKDGYKSGRLKPAFKGKKHTQETKDKIIATYIENRTNNKYRGTYKGIYFQYSFELAWIVWNLEHGIKIFRCEETFEYWDSEQKKMRTYYPDFQLEDGTIVEIKGRVTQCVYDKQAAVVNKYKRKYVLLTQDKIQHCLDYCKEKYGNDFLTKLKDT